MCQKDISLILVQTALYFLVSHPNLSLSIVGRCIPKFVAQVNVSSYSHRVSVILPFHLSIGFPHTRKPDSQLLQGQSWLDSHEMVRPSHFMCYLCTAQFLQFFLVQSVLDTSFFRLPPSTWLCHEFFSFLSSNINRTFSWHLFSHVLLFICSTLFCCYVCFCSSKLSNTWVGLLVMLFAQQRISSYYLMIIHNLFPICKM